MVRQMDIILSNSSGKPIYEQISDQVKSQILSGTLAEGDALPSMRLLAKELHISVITTKRAYEELEREGFLQNIPGKGCFVGPPKPGTAAGSPAAPGGGVSLPGCGRGPKGRLHPGRAYGNAQHIVSR